MMLQLSSPTPSATMHSVTYGQTDRQSYCVIRVRSARTPRSVTERTVRPVCLTVVNLLIIVRARLEFSDVR